MIQIKGFAVKKSKISVKIKNKILFFAQSYKKALLALWFLTVEELRKLICSSRKQGNKAMSHGLYCIQPSMGYKYLCL